MSIVPLDALQLTGDENQSSEVISVYKYGVYRDCNVKVEFKFEDDNFIDEDGNDFTDDMGKFSYPF